MVKQSREHSPSNLKEKFLKTAAVISMGSLTLTGCGSEKVEAQSDLQQSQGIESISETPEESTSPEVEKPNKEYKMSPERTHYQEIIDTWYEQDLETIKAKSSVDTESHDPVGRAEYIAALYQKYAEQYDVISNSYLDIGDVNYQNERQGYVRNPIFGTNPLEANSDQLNAMLGSLEVITILEGLETVTKKSGYVDNDEYVYRTQKAFHTLSGDSEKQFRVNFGWPGVNFKSTSQKADEEPRRVETITKRISEEDVINMGAMNRFNPIDTPYETMWVMITPKDEKAKEETGDYVEIRRLIVIPLSEGKNKIPDFNGPRRGFEYAPEDSPITMGHAVSSFSVPVTQRGVVFDANKLNINAVE